MMFADAELYSHNLSIQLRDAHSLLDCVLNKMSWAEEEIVMDLGCGSGDSAKSVILQRIPNLKLLIGVDVLPSMIDFAKSNRSHEKIEYHVADVENWSTLQSWQGMASKLFSIHCFHWLKDQNLAFENVYKLLAPGGEAAFYFVLTTPHWDQYPSLIKKSKWWKYLENAEQGVPISHHLQYGGDHYRNILESMGFQVVACEEENKLFSYNNDLHCRAATGSRSALTNYIPDGEREDFFDDLFEGFIRHCGRDSNGKPQLKCKCLLLHVKKM